jgi:hypothetical protein
MQQQQDLEPAPMMVLSDKFLVAPRFRLTVRAYNEAYTDFSVLFNRTNSRLGLTIGLMVTGRDSFDSEVIVSDVALPEENDNEAAVSSSSSSSDADVMFDRSSSSSSTGRFSSSAGTGSGRPTASAASGSVVVKPAAAKMMHLGYDAGVKKADVITGIDSINLAAGIEIGEVERMLKSRPEFVTLHFRRRRSKGGNGQQHLHKWASLLQEQNVISEERAEYVTKCLERVRDRVVQWETGTLEEGPADFSSSNNSGDGGGGGCDGIGNGTTTRGSTGGMYSHQQHLKRGSLAREMSLLGSPPPASLSSSSSTNDVNNSNAVRSRNLSTGNLSSIVKSAPLQVETRGLRLALATRVLRAEQNAGQGGHTWYVIWVMDVRSGHEWTVRRRFSEFFQLREALLNIRSSIRVLEFPPKRYAGAKDSAATITERVRLLNKFLRRTSSLLCVNSLHPTTSNVHRAIQDFLDCPLHQQAIVRRERESCEHENADAAMEGYTQARLQEFVHGVMQMQVMDRILDTFLDNFSAEAATDARRSYSMDAAKEFLYDLRDFMNNLHGIMVEGLSADSVALLATACTSKRVEWMSEAQEEEETARGSVEREQAREQLAAMYLDPEERGFSPRTADGGEKDNSNSDSNDSVHARRLKAVSRVETRPEDDTKMVVKEVLRRQVEIEVYVHCSARLNSIVNEAFYQWEYALARQIAGLKGLPQSFFGIQVQFISPSSWDSAVLMLRQIRTFSLPHDRLAHLIKVCKYIPDVFAQEHPTSQLYLGADDFLPIFIYILVMANIPQMLSLHEEMLTFVDPMRRMGEAGYYLASFEAAISHIREVDPASPEGLFRQQQGHDSSDDSDDETARP